MTWTEYELYPSRYPWQYFRDAMEYVKLAIASQDFIGTYFESTGRGLMEYGRNWYYLHIFSTP